LPLKAKQLLRDKYKICPHQHHKIHNWPWSGENLAAVKKQWQNKAQKNNQRLAEDGLAF